MLSKLPNVVTHGRAGPLIFQFVTRLLQLCYTREKSLNSWKSVSYPAFLTLYSIIVTK